MTVPALGWARVAVGFKKLLTLKFIVTRSHRAAVAAATLLLTLEEFLCKSELRIRVSTTVRTATHCVSVASPTELPQLASLKFPFYT